MIRNTVIDVILDSVYIMIPSGQSNASINHDLSHPVNASHTNNTTLNLTRRSVMQLQQTIAIFGGKTIVC